MEHSDFKIRTSLQAPAGGSPHYFSSWKLDAPTKPRQPNRIDAIIATARSRIRRLGSVELDSEAG